MIFNLYFSFLKSATGFCHEIKLASSADLCQSDFIKTRLGPLRAMKLLSKIQEDAFLWGVNKHYFHKRYRSYCFTMVPTKHTG